MEAYRVCRLHPEVRSRRVGGRFDPTRPSGCQRPLIANFNHDISIPRAVFPSFSKKVALRISSLNEVPTGGYTLLCV